jgi:hypothetical protein
MNDRNRIVCVVTALLLLVSFGTGLARAETGAQGVNPMTSQDAAKKFTTFRDYWYRGLAEVNRYEVQQSRYGEMHKGESVLIFVTEDFLRDKQVKYEFGDKSNAVNILKLNAQRRFYTGIYPYTIMTSTFSPTNGEPTQKVTSTSQEWCGMTYVQLNRLEQGYQGVSHSYFQAEADERFKLGDSLLEDEVWTRMRQDPMSLPIGDLKVVPAMHFLRLMHKPTRAYAAKASWQDATSEVTKAAVRSYRITYPALGRTLSIILEQSFPFRIVEFTETNTPLFGRDGNAPAPMTTRAILTRSIMLDYWSKNRLSDAPYRDALGLEH